MLKNNKLTQDERKDIFSRIINIKENISKKEKELDKIKKKLKKIRTNQINNLHFKELHL